MLALISILKFSAKDITRTMTVVFFGHRDAPYTVREKLRSVLVELIETNDANMFYVGNQGHFDAMVKNELRELKCVYSHIRYAVVLAYLPNKAEAGDDIKAIESLYPWGLEQTPPRFAIAKRNRWMVEEADIVVAYVAHLTGGAAQYKALAEKKGKQVINLYDCEGEKA